MQRRNDFPNSVKISLWISGNILSEIRLRRIVIPFRYRFGMLQTEEHQIKALIK